ncbi:Hsp20/alpha crystallin family protein [Thermincola ferriacetica]
MNSFNPFDGQNFNPFDALKERNIPSVSMWFEQMKQFPWLEKYINDILGPNFWRQITGGKQQSFSSKTEVFETSDEVIVKLPIPGLEKTTDIRVKLSGVTLWIEASPPANIVELDHDRIKLHKDAEPVSPRKISHTVKLPAPVNYLDAKAIYKSGTLEIRLPKEFNSEDTHDIRVNFL